MIVLILAGGSGTRLQSVVKDKPKPMADVLGRPFIRYLSDYLFSSGCSKIYLSCFHLWEQIADEYITEISQNKVEIILEPKKLGTGGAIFYCISQIFAKHPDAANIVVCNGDSFCNFDINYFLDCHTAFNNIVSVLSVIVPNTGRYGVLEIEKNDVISFKEKTKINDINTINLEPINAGIYCINKQILEYFSILADKNEEFSFEEKVLTVLANQRNLKCITLKSEFIDIGIPEDYYKATEFFSKK